MPPSSPPRVFISYARRDAEPLARRLQSELEAHGFDAWLDKQRLHGGASRTKEIETALDRATHVLALLTEGSYTSEICRAEHHPSPGAVRLPDDRSPPAAPASAQDRGIHRPDRSGHPRTVASPLHPALHPPGTSLLRTLAGHVDWLLGVSLSADGRRAVSASSDRTLKVWNVETGKATATFTCDHAVLCCALADDLIVAGDAGGRVHFLHLEK